MAARGNISVVEKDHGEVEERPDRMLSAEDFLTLEPRTEKVYIPRLQGSVFVREMTAGERDEFTRTRMDIERGGKAKVDIETFRTKWIVKCVVDADGNPIFQGGHRFRLQMLGTSEIGRLWSKIEELCQFDEDDAKEVSESLDETQDGNSSID
jgi:CRISPR/Cas system-associated endoribonuclease Cas2